MPDPLDRLDAHSTSIAMPKPRGNKRKRSKPKKRAKEPEEDPKESPPVEEAPQINTEEKGAAPELLKPNKNSPWPNFPPGPLEISCTPPFLFFRLDSRVACPICFWSHAYRFHLTAQDPCPASYPLREPRLGTFVSGN